MVFEEGTSVFPPYVSGAVTVVLLLLVVASFFSNLLVAVVSAKKCQIGSRSSHVGSNRFVFNLCLTNTAQMLIISPFIVVSSVKQTWIFGSGWCKASGFFYILFSTNSLLSIMILSIDLYHCIVNPLTYNRTMTHLSTICFIVFTWIASLVAAVIPLFGWGMYGYQRLKYSCTVVWDRTISAGYARLYSVLFIISFIVNCCAYYYIVKAAKRQARILPVNNTPYRGSISSTLSANFTGSKALRISLLVLGSVSLCWGVYIVTILLESSKINSTSELQVTTTLLNHLMSLLYPIVYGIRIRKTRRRIRRFIISMFMCGQDNNVRPISSANAGFYINSSHAFRNRSVSEGSVLDGGRDIPSGWCLPAIVEETDESNIPVITEITDLDRLPGHVPC